MAEPLTEAEIARLKQEVSGLRFAVRQAARYLRGPLRADTLNEAIRALNAALDKADHIPEVAWGVASLGAVQAQVRNLCEMVALPEYAAFLTRRIDHAPPVPMKRQLLGGQR